LAVEAQKLLAAKDINAYVVSMPCVEWFNSQPQEYRDSVLPPDVSARVAVEAGVAQSWYRFVGDTGEIISIEHYGESADDKTLFREFGFTAENVADAAERVIDNYIHTSNLKGTSWHRIPTSRRCRRPVYPSGSTTCPGTG
jgi:transketolase